MGKTSDTRENFTGERLRIARNVWGYNQSDLLEDTRWDSLVRIDHRSTLGKWEKYGIPDRMIPKVAAFFYVPDVFFTDTSIPLENVRMAISLRKADHEGAIDHLLTLRQVRKVICLIKGIREEDNSPVLLTYFSPDWGMALFPNVSSDDRQGLPELLGERINVDPGSIRFRFTKGHQKLHDKHFKKTADTAKADRHGDIANYIFDYAVVEIKNPPAHLLRESFTVNDIVYQWRSLNSLKMDERVRTFNHDVLQFISRVFDATLSKLPTSFAKTFKISRGLEN